MKRKLIVLTLGFVFTIAIGLGLSPMHHPSRASAQIPERGSLQCTNGLLNGRYGFEIKGTLAGVGPVALVGAIHHSYDGTYTGNMTASYNGQIVPFLPFNGQFAVNSDCSATGSFTLPDGTKVSTKMVVVDRGREYFIVNTDPGNVLSGVVKRID